MRFFDLWGIPNDNGDIESYDYLFLGDYVDRGNYGPEVAAYLFCLKIKNPSDIIMLRGNHESRDMAEHFNFRDQVLMLYD